MSQLGADDWILENFKTPGFFLDVGCHDGYHLSNTYKLEKRGWKGICIDPFPTNFDNRPNTIIEKAVVYSEKDKEVEFYLLTGKDNNDIGLSGIKDTLNRHKETVQKADKEIFKFKTQLLVDILDKHNAPKYIEYMNIDIEGSEYEVLSTFDFSKYTFGAITVEHNYEEPKRTMIKEILEKNGYIKHKEVEWDDWYLKINSNNFKNIFLVLFLIGCIIIFLFFKYKWKDFH